MTLQLTLSPYKTLYMSYVACVILNGASKEKNYNTRDTDLTLRLLMSYIYIYIYDISSLMVNDLTLILLTWREW